MRSSQVNAGDTGTIGQYNNLRDDAFDAQREVIFDAVANEDLTAGQTVSISSLGGGIARASKPLTTFSLADTASYGKPIHLGGDRFFLLYRVNGGNVLKGVVLTINRANNTISVGTAVQYTTDVYSNGYDACLINTDKVAVAYATNGSPSEMLLQVSTISTATITIGSVQYPFDVPLGGNIDFVYMTKVDTDKAVLYTRGQVKVFTVSGSSLGSIGTRVNSIVVSRIVSHATGAFTLFGNVSGNAEDSIQCGTVSGTTITLGTSVVLSTYQSSTTASGLCVIDSTHVAVAYGTASDSAVRGVSISGTTPTLGTAVSTGLNGGRAINYDSVSGYIYYGDFQKVYTISGTTLTYQFDPVGTGWTSVGYNKYFDTGSYFGAILCNSSGNSFTVKGMCSSFLPVCIANQTVSRTAAIEVRMSGKAAGQTGVVAGQRYTANGSGGISLNAAGELMGVSATEVVII